MKKILKVPLVFFLTLMARVALWKHKPTIIAITGSVGKTTTKDILYCALRDVVDVRASSKSYNSDIGVPLSVFGLDNPYTSLWKWFHVYTQAIAQIISPNFPKVLDLEVGIGAPGDMTNITKWMSPDISIFTQLSPDPVHLEFFDSREDIYQEKKTLATATKQSGVVIYNGSDSILERVLNDVVQQKVAFTLPPFVRMSKEGTHITIDTHEVLLRDVVAFHFRNAVSISYEVSKTLDVEITEVLASLEKNYQPTPGRARLIKGINETIIIDDAYNASPVAVRASLSSFEKFHTEGRKIFVFGDMMELGDIEDEAHKDIANYINFLDELITVGPRALLTHKASEDKNISAKHFDTSDEAGAYLKKSIHKNDAILFKASRHSIQMERAIVQIALPEEKDKLVQDYL
jgi:UDP-N-acetylmuramoyl-tripeptide--D-alanyl-D-alanine ligase